MIIFVLLSKIIELLSMRILYHLQRAGASASRGNKRFVTSCLKFLTSFSTAGYKSQFFDVDANLSLVCDTVILSNILLLEEDEELFKHNCLEFVKRAGEGSHVDTRRSIACNCLKQLCHGKIHSLLATWTDQCHKLWFSDTRWWKHMEVVTYVAASLAYKDAMDDNGILQGLTSFLNSCMAKLLQVDEG